MSRRPSNPIRLLDIAIFLIMLGVCLVGWGISNRLYLQRTEIISPVTNSISTISISSKSAETTPTGQPARVTKVIDGDTIEVSIEEDNNQSSNWTVRYIGIDTPETVDPRRSIGCFGKEASAENKRLVDAQKVYLVKDISEMDKYGRLLRYVFLQKWGELIFVNDYLVKQGFARVSTIPPDVQMSSVFVQSEQSARDNKLGLWQKCL